MVMGLDNVQLMQTQHSKYKSCILLTNGTNQNAEKGTITILCCSDFVNNIL